MMLTKTGLLTMLNTEEALYDYLHVVPFETTTKSVVNRLKSTYPKMEDAAIIYDEENIFIPYTMVNYGALEKEIETTIYELTSAMIEILHLEIKRSGSWDYEDKINKKCYGKYSGDEGTLIEFDDKKDLTAWLNYNDDFAKEFHITKDNAVFKRMAATDEEIKKILSGNHTYNRNDMTGEKTITAE